MSDASSRVLAGTYKYAARVKGLAWNCTVRDVSQFLLGSHDLLAEEQVVFIYNAAGDAFVRLSSSDEVERAVRHSGRPMYGGGKVDVWRSTGAEADEWAWRARDRPSGSFRGVVKMKGLPYASTEADVAEIFFDGKISKRQVVLVHAESGRPRGEAYVCSSTVEKAKRLMIEYDKKELGGRWIDLTEASRGEFYAAEHAAAKLTADGPSDDSYLRVRGLPFEATRRDVSDFFREYGVTDTDVLMAARTQDGRPSGEAFVRFPSVDEARAARAERNGKEIGGRWLEIYVAGAAEVAQKCGAALRAAQRPDAADASVIHLRGLPFQATLADVERLVTAASDASKGAFRLRSPVAQSVFLTSEATRRPTGEAYALLAHGDGQEASIAAAGISGATLGGRLVTAVPATKSDLYAALGDEALQSTCVHLRGLPFSACSDDQHLANNFFNDLNLVQAFLCRDRTGYPTGNAYAELLDFESMLGTLAKNRADLEGRFVEVFSCSKQEFDTELSNAQGGGTATRGAGGATSYRAAGPPANGAAAYQGRGGGGGPAYSSSSANYYDGYQQQQQDPYAAAPPAAPHYGGGGGGPGGDYYGHGGGGAPHYSSRR